MATTVDHLGSDQRIRVLKDFTDGAAQAFRAGETGLIRHIHLDQRTWVCTIELDQSGAIRPIVLHNTLTANGPRSGNLREYFEVLGYEYEQAPKGPRAPVKPDGPAWYLHALVLEEQNELEKAEQLIRDSVPDLHFAIVVAEMYRHRWQRLRYLGDLEGANAAREQSRSYAWFLASQATSGGEGAALSRERDRFLATLED